MSAPVVAGADATFDLPRGQRRLVGGTIAVAFLAMGIAVINGLGQALNYAGIDILSWFPGMRTYYQGLTAHGVLMAIVFTFAFANGFVALAMARGLNRKLHGGLLWSAFLVLAAGVVLAGYAIVTGQASVLYTFYSPMQAHWTFYLGAALLVVSTWLTSALLFVMLARWKRENPGERIPLLAFVSVCTYVMWDIASIGIAVEVVGFLLPWSLGWLGGTDALLNRTLFWYTGHPIVYFWLLPAYISWYTMVPEHAGGALHSDALTRVVFLMFLALSIPVGFHHQYTDPGIDAGMKAVHTVLTFGVFFPSLVTAFSVMAGLELGARRRGGTGLLRWIRKLPWDHPPATLQMLAMLVFLLGGITGLILASYNINEVVHNTAFVPGHFHMTVGTAVALSFMGIAYWLVPWLTGRELWGRKAALAQGWLWFVGVLVFARGMISGGIQGMPRRTLVSEAPYAAGQEGWELAGTLTGLGGSLMFLSGILFFVVLAGTVLLGRRAEPGAELAIPFTETLRPPATTGWEPHLDRFRYWVALTLILILVAYGPFLATYLPPRLLSPGFHFF